MPATVGCNKRNILSQFGLTWQQEKISWRETVTQINELSEVNKSHNGEGDTKMYQLKS